MIGHVDMPESIRALKQQEGNEPKARPVEYNEWQRLLECYRDLGPTAREVLVMTAERLAAGRKAYNDDFDADRNMAHEALEEAADLAVYCQVGLIKARGRGKVLR
jgi:hypothetical protein